ncbi:Erg28-like protein [Exidia glandulosa HHB12029]|uniref:Erg28-like protein n=1 Tax=Exidia glandulosa HHB12029 TaxID=1314781 RepID=A0A165Q168_EXIGL|nr:Erg28-like protein [Exidia glandulosa HHB12029]
MSHLLPQFPGLLPKWMLFVSSMAVFNAVQNLTTVSLTRRIYSAQPSLVSPLSARTFGTWTFLSAIVRLYCAYNITEKTIYDVTLWSYAIVIFHFGSEWLYFRTASPGAGLLSPVIIGSISFFWMFAQRDYYLGL